MKASVASTIYWLAFTLLAVRMLLFVDDHAVDLLFNDQWSYLTTSLYPHNLVEGFFTRLGPHRIGLGFPFFKFSLAISDYNSCSISFMVCAFAIVNALIFSFLKVKRIGPLRLTDLYIPLVFFTLNQYAIF
ncbi:MAG: hypothetical protein U5L96_15055 [Owenweeksia sp.]|nr:hypothetical protein [Owenweeksia sp.]